jgi:type 2 lantibiotic biosynthesis protein LanM
MIKQNVIPKNLNFDVFKFNKYMAMYPFNDKDAFSQWLDTNDLNYDQFLLWFDKDNTGNKSMEDCPWMDYLLNIYKPAINVSSKYSNQFGVCIDFMVEKASYDFNKKISIIKNVHNEKIKPQIFKNIFIQELRDSLASMITPTLTLELNVSRVSKQLFGENSKERYTSYIRMLSDKVYVLKIFDEYPVLLERLITKCIQSISELIEFYTRLITDFKGLSENFGELKSFIGFSNKKGDDHNNGRSVRICNFSNKKIVYKPRNLQADITFQKLLLDINKVANTKFKPYFLLEKGTYGWSDFIDYKACNNSNELSNYYFNMGNYICLLYLLNSGDFHYENIISNGENPILVDLETIFHIDINLDNKTPFSIKKHTVMDSLILPQKTKFTNQESYLDFSVLGYLENQSITNTLEVNFENKRDDLSYSPTKIKAPISKQAHSNICEFNLSNDDISELLVSGFTHLYEFFSNNREWLFINHNFNLLSTQTYRAILRPTDIYYSLIKYSLHPDYLRNRTDFILFLQQKLWGITKFKPQFKKIINKEIENIVKDNIPIFHFKPTSKSLILNGESIIENALNSNLLNNINEITENLSESNKKIQLWHIRASMNTKDMANKNTGFKLANLNSQTSDVLLINDYINTVTNNLMEISIVDNNITYWRNYQFLSEEQWTLSLTQGLNLFDGTLGTLIYLLNHAKINNNKKLLSMSDSTITEMIDTFDSQFHPQIGGYNGIGGIIYGLTKIYEITHNNKIIPFVKSLANILESKISDDDYFDILYGSAGAILSLLYAHKVFSHNIFLSTAIKCGYHLKDNFSIQNVGGGWKGKSGNGNILGGFSHGVSGIAYALIKLSHISCVNEFIDCANLAIDYEDSLYCSDSKNYKDLRISESNHCLDSDMTAWCNGLVGINLSRLDILVSGLLPDRNKQFLEEIKRDNKKIIGSGFGHNHSLCHGDAGTLEYLYQVSEHFPDILSKTKFNENLIATVNDIVNSNQKNGAPFNVFSPGIMMGSLGVAYQCMRFSSHKEIGNILLLN